MAINWYFEETRLDSGGDPSALNFKNTIEAALREALQNAIDAKWEQNTVPVKIELIVLKDKKLKKDFLDALKFDQLRSHIQGCIDKTNTGGEILDQLKHGMKNMLKNDPLLLLKISDYTTTGLYGSEGPGEFSNSYRGLIWSKNVASDKGADSGGSFGMGKIAYSGISNIRTFLVNSNISTNKPGIGIKEDDEIRNIDLKTLSEGYMNRLIGRADLITHPSENKEYNYIEDGRFGETKNGYAESIWNDKELLKRLYMDRGNASGTTVLIPGVFTTDNITDKQNTDFQNDVNEIKNKIIKNFWPALHKNNLSVEIILTVDNEQELKHEIKPEEAVPNFINLLTKYEDSLVNPKETLEDVNEKNVSKVSLDEESDKGFCVNLNIPKTKKNLLSDYKKFEHSSTDHDVAVLVQKVNLNDLTELERELVNTYAQFRGPGIIVEYTNSSDQLTNFINFDTGDSDIIAVGVYGTYRQVDEDAFIADRFLKWIEPPHHDMWNPKDKTANKWTQYYDENEIGGKRIAANKKYFEHTTLVKNLLNNLFREKIDYREDTPEYQKKLLTVNFKGKKGSGGGGGVITSGGKIVPKTNLAYNEKSQIIKGTTSFNIPNDYKVNSLLNIDLRSVLIDAMGKSISIDIKSVSKNLEISNASGELKIKSISKDRKNKAKFSWEVKAKTQNINPTAISLDLKINKKKAGE